jgi:hypothetical protein
MPTVLSALVMWTYTGRLPPLSSAMHVHLLTFCQRFNVPLLVRRSAASCACLCVK